MGDAHPGVVHAPEPSVGEKREAVSARRLREIGKRDVHSDIGRRPRRSRISWTSAVVGASSFSLKTCFPAAIAARITAVCSVVSFVTITPSTSGFVRTSSRSPMKGTPMRSCGRLMPRSASRSQIAARSRAGVVACRVGVLIRMDMPEAQGPRCRASCPPQPAERGVRHRTKASRSSTSLRSRDRRMETLENRPSRARRRLARHATRLSRSTLRTRRGTGCVRPAGCRPRPGRWTRSRERVRPAPSPR